MIETYLTYENGTDVKSIIKSIEAQEVEQFLLESSHKAHEVLLVFKDENKATALNFRREPNTCKVMEFEDGSLVRVTAVEKLSLLMCFDEHVVDHATECLDSLASIELSLK